MKNNWVTIVMVIVGSVAIYVLADRISGLNTEILAQKELIRRHEVALGIVISVAKNDLVWQSEDCGAVEFCWGPRPHEH